MSLYYFKNKIKKLNPKKSISFATKFLLLAMGVCSLQGCQSSEDTPGKKIGIIVPIQHKALDEIVASFTETLRAQTNEPLQFKVLNAQGDINIQRAIIQQMKSNQYDLVVPIGLVATQMSLATIHQQPIVGLAAHYTEVERQQQKPCNITAVHDEIPPQQSLEFIHHIYPEMTQLTLIHSAEDKIFPQVDEAVAAGKALGITIKPLLVPSLNELFSIAKAIPADSQGIFVLKDNTIVSSISTLALVANERHLPLMTSDQDSVTIGAGFAVGVFERDIGVEGAKLAKAVLEGQPICEIPIVDMKNLRVFINKKMLTLEGQSVEAVTKAAKQSGYEVVFTTNANENANVNENEATQKVNEDA